MRKGGFVKYSILTLAGLVISLAAAGQSIMAESYSRKFYSDLPVWAIKTNLLYDATSTINLGVEVGLAPNMTLDISGNYNPWTLSNGRKFRHWLIQPEYRYWLNSRFNGSFFGVHVHYAEYNINKIHLFSTTNRRKQGNLYGLGVSFGHQFRIAGKWSIEATIGVGYAHLRYDQYDCSNCGRYIGTKHKNYFGPTKAGISIIYLIK